MWKKGELRQHQGGERERKSGRRNYSRAGGSFGFFFLPLSPFFSTIQPRILEAPPRLALAKLRPINPRGSKTTSFPRFPRNLVSAGCAETLLARRRSFLDAKRERGGSEEKPSHQAPKHHPLPPPRAALPSSHSLASPRRTVHLTALYTSRA